MVYSNSIWRCKSQTLIAWTRKDFKLRDPTPRLFKCVQLQALSTWHICKCLKFQIYMTMFMILNIKPWMKCILRISSLIQTKKENFKTLLRLEIFFLICFIQRMIKNRHHKEILVAYLCLDCFTMISLLKWMKIVKNRHNLWNVENLTKLINCPVTNCMCFGTRLIFLRSLVQT